MESSFPECSIICREERSSDLKANMIHTRLGGFWELQIQRNTSYMINERLWSRSRWKVHKVTDIFVTLCVLVITSTAYRSFFLCFSIENYLYRCQICDLQCVLVHICDLEVLMYNTCFYDTNLMLIFENYSIFFSSVSLGTDLKIKPS